MATSRRRRASHPSTPEALEDWLRNELARQMKVEPASVDLHAPFHRLGLNSALGLALLERLSRLLERTIEPTVLWRHPTVARLARHLTGGAEDRAREGRSGGPRAAGTGLGEPVAVVGLACRFPGGPDPRSFWRLLRRGDEAIREIPPERWDAAALHDPDRSAPGRIVTRRGYFLDAIDGFDASFFRVAPREARHMDPQQRLLLEVVWEAAEAAGLPPAALEGRPAGVFVGALWSDYAALLLEAGPEALGPYSATGVASSVLANRISYLLGLRGPSLTVDTACSSSLVAVHLACQSLALGESEVAFAGGVGLMSSAYGTLFASKFGGLSPEGRSKAFDARADGYGRGEGAGVVVLKPLSRALDDGDPIHALIRGGAVNNDGASNGLTAPNPQAQVDVLRDAYARAGVDPAEVDWVEAHGTGTLLGDPIEVSALGEVLGADRPEDRPLRIGSVKTNIGHLEGAAGVAGLIKTVLALAEREMPPSLHCERPNPHIPFDRLGVEVNTAPRPWPREATEPGRAGVSSFGFGGTNCHLVLEGWTAASGGVFAAAAEEGRELRRIAAVAAERLERREAEPAEVAAEAARNLPAVSDPDRPAAHRLAVPFQGRLDLVERLRAFAAGESPELAAAAPSAPAGDARRPVFVLPGHGSQWPGMGMRLYQSEPVFRRALDRIERAYREHAGRSLLAAMRIEGPASRMERAEVSIPSLFAVQVALDRLWRSWGVAPAAYLGHSHGEIAAAHLAGALSLEQAIVLVHRLGELYDRIFAYGSMLLVPVPPETAGKLIAGREDAVDVAVHHTPDSTILSGEPEALAEIRAELEARSLQCFSPRVPAAPHSPRVEPLMGELRETLHGLETRPELATPIVSTLTGDFVDGRELGADHWVTAMRRPALFTRTLERLAERGHTLFLELSAHPILGKAIRQTYRSLGRPADTLGSMHAGADGTACLRESAARLFLGGLPVDWRAVAGVDEPDGPVLVTLSAADDGALGEAAGRWTDHVATGPGRGAGLADLAATANLRRQHLAHRAAVVAASRNELVERLHSLAGGRSPRGVAAGTLRADRGRTGCVFLFSGQGSQWPGMGRALLEREPAFRSAVEECDRLYRERTGSSLLPYLRRVESTDPAGEAPAETTRVVQPALFALQVGLAALWRSRGVTPAAVVGHSVGEVAAAAVAGALSLDDGLRVIDHRSRLMERTSGRGAMAQVELPAEALRPHVEPFRDRLSVAAVNGPRASVVSGETGALDELLEALRACDVPCRRLRVDCAFHSPQMTPLRDELETALRGLEPVSPEIPLFSTLTGGPVDGDRLDATHWARAVREPVLFAPALEALLGRIGEGVGALVEIGPRGSLCGYAREILAQAGRGPGSDPAVVPSLRRDRRSPGGGDPRVGLLEAAGALYAAGCPVDLSTLDPAPSGSRRVVSLPSYPWQRRRYWLDEELAVRSADRTARPLHGRAVEPRPNAEPAHRLVWRHAELGAREEPAERTGPTDRPSGGHAWLVVGAEDGLGPRVAEALRRRGESVRLACPAEDDDPADPGHLRRLFDELPDAPRGIRVVHLVGADLDLRTDELRPVEEPVHRRLTGGLLVLAREIADGRPVRDLSVVTRGAAAVDGSALSTGGLLQAPLRGLARTAAVEIGSLRTTLVDLDPTGRADPEDETESLLAILERPPVDERQLALRGDRLLAPRLTPAAPRASAPRSELSPDGTYLITGGLGALGLAVAGRLVERGARHLLLIGRRGPSEDARNQIAALEAAGARVAVARADVTERTQMSRVLERADGAPPLRGVVHAAGIADDAPLTGLDWERAWRGMEAKVSGAWVLHELTLEADALDLFVLFSSAAALGNPGQGPYAAGNAFLDVLAEHRRALGLPAVSLAWGPWDDTGLAAERADGGGRTWAERGIRPLAPERALDLFDRWSAGAAPRVILLDADWRTLADNALLRPIWEPLVRELGAGAPSADPGTRVAPPPRPGSPAETIDYLRRLTGELLGAAEPVATDRSFQDLGVDSLMVGEAVAHLRRDLGLAVFPRELLDHPTIEALAVHLWHELERAPAERTAEEGGRSPAAAGPFHLRRLGARPPTTSSPPDGARAPEPSGEDRAEARPVLLLSSPRSGSTLLRVMLAGHPALFSPPELHLLAFRDLAERRRALEGTGLGEGLERALMELTGDGLDGVRERLERWTEEELSIPAVYRRLQELVGDRLLVDKSPSYAADARALRRAEHWLDRPRVIHLVRHPTAVIDSFVRSRMQHLVAADPDDPYRLAEEIWTAGNANLLDWLAEEDGLPAERYLRVRFEDLVRRPRPVLETVCRFLDVPFRDEVLTPYEGDRMTDGVHSRSLPVGDPTFAEHRTIEADRAEAWRSVRLPHPLGFEARRLVRRLGYTLGSGGAPGTAGPGAAGRPCASAAGRGERPRRKEWRTAGHGIELCVSEWGPRDGATALCLHGFLAQGPTWQPVAELLASRGHRVVAPDLRGHGRSDHAPPGARFDVTDVLADVDALRRRVDGSGITLVGHSFGAGLAALYAGLRPEAVERLILVEPVSFPAPSAEERIAVLAGRLEREGSRPEPTVFPDLEAAATRLRRLLEGAPEKLTRELAARATRKVPGGLIWRHDPALLEPLARSFDPEVFRELLARVRAPVTVLQGDRSDHTRSDGIWREALRRRPAWSVVVAPGGHQLHLEAPADVAEILAGSPSAHVS